MAVAGATTKVLVTVGSGGVVAVGSGVDVGSGVSVGSGVDVADTFHTCLFARCKT